MISSALDMVAVVGLVIAGFGLFVATQSVARDRSARNGIVIMLVGVAIALVFLAMSAGVVEIQPNEVGVVFNVLSGKLSDTPLQPGLHIVLPGIQEVTIYSTAQQEYTVSGTPYEGAVRGDDAIVALTKDGQQISMDVTLIYSIDPAKVNIVHKRWQDRYVTALIRPTLRSETRAALTNFSVEEIYAGDRTVLVSTIEENIRKKIEPEGFQLSSVMIRNITFSQEYVNSIERKQVAQQEALEAEFRVQQRKQEAEQARELARGEADAARIRAEGEAEALRLINEQLQQNPLLLQWRYVEQLSDNVQLIIIPSGSPFLFDMQSLMEVAGNGSGTSAGGSTSAE